jgi:hypothetical protein
VGRFIAGRASCACSGIWLSCGTRRRSACGPRRVLNSRSIRPAQHPVVPRRPFGLWRPKAGPEG